MVDIAMGPEGWRDMREREMILCATYIPIRAEQSRAEQSRATARIKSRGLPAQRAEAEGQRKSRAD
jgi:hypothetical protein